MLSQTLSQPGLSTSMPYYKRKRTRRPRAKKRVDKDQNRRIARLENTKERKVFDIVSLNAQSLPAPFPMTSYLKDTSGYYTAQIKDFTCAPSQGLTDTTRIGDQIEIKSLKMRLQISFHGTNTNQSANGRVMVFWDHTPVQAVGSTTAIPTVADQLVTWESLLQLTDTNVNADNDSYGALYSYHQADINKRKPPRFTWLMDKNIVKSTVVLNLNKSYKALRHKFLAAGKDVLNKRLYVAYVSDIASNGAVQPRIYVQARYVYTDS